MSKKKINIEKKRENEKAMMLIMTKIYCKGNYHEREGQELCPSCQELVEYANFRTDKCPFMETKTFCSACKVHCYKPDKRELVREVMRYSGPRMLTKHPVLAVKHMMTTGKMKWEQFTKK